MIARGPVMAQIQTGLYDSLEGRVSGEASHLVTGLLQVMLEVMVMSVVEKSSYQFLIMSMTEGSYQKKSTFLSDIVQKGGGVQPESKSFEVVLFSPILTLFWTLNGGGEGGFTLFQKF